MRVKILKQATYIFDMNKPEDKEQQKELIRNTILGLEGTEPDMIVEAPDGRMIAIVSIHEDDDLSPEDGAEALLLMLKGRAETNQDMQGILEGEAEE